MSSTYAPGSGLIRNLTDEDHCLHCCAHPGLVVTEWDHRHPTIHHEVGVKPKDCRHCIENYGPCPFCELGNRLEFPRGDVKPPWGKNGVWKGLKPNHSDLPLTCDCKAELTRKDDAIKMLADLIGHVSAWDRKQVEKPLPEMPRLEPLTPRASDADEQAALAEALADQQRADEGVTVGTTATLL